MAQRGGNSAVEKIDELDIGALAVRTATSVVKQRPITVSFWAIGLALAAFAKGFSVDEVARETYSMSLEHANKVGRQDLSKALQALNRAEQKHYNAKGWFWACDQKCQRASDKVAMARGEVERLQRQYDHLLTDARKEVGIWSVFGVQDVRNSFWDAWKSGKDFATRYTMMDAMFIMIGGQEETMISMALKLLMQYIINLTMGLIGAFFFFIYNVYHLIVSYGEPTLSGIAFFLLVLVSGMATVGTYLFAIYGTVAGGGIYLLKKAAKQAAVEGGRQGRPRQVQYGAGRPNPSFGGYRSHMD